MHQLSEVRVTVILMQTRAFHKDEEKQRSVQADRFQYI